MIQWLAVAGHADLSKNESVTKARLCPQRDRGEELKRDS